MVSIIGLLVTVFLAGQASVQKKRRDATRVANIRGLQQALALHFSKSETYPVFTGCLTGTDLVTAALRVSGAIGADSRFVDPLNPTDVAKCYYYTGTTGSTYSIRYTLETNSTAGNAGDVTVVP